ncbi:MAG: proline racemase family protein [Acidobacteriota bacterium]
MTITLKTIDAHVGGQPLRLVVDGFPSPPGRTMFEKRDWVRRKKDHLRRALMLEPRGHGDMSGAVLTEAVSPGSHAGVVFLHNDGYSTMSGHGIIAVTTIALERGLLMPGGDGKTVVYDVPAGTIRAEATLGSSFDAGNAGKHPTAVTGFSAHRAAHDGIEPATMSHVGPRVARVGVVGVPSFVLHGGLSVKLGTRHIRADVAFGGGFYAIVDSEAVGLPLDASHLPELRRLGMDIKEAIEAGQDIVHPLDQRLRGLAGTIFTGPPHHLSADLRNVTVFADAQVDRSPCGAGTAAVMAVLEAIGLLSDNRPFVHESILGTQFEGRVCGREPVADYEAILAEVSGSAWITGEHTFCIDDADPLKNGFKV